MARTTFAVLLLLLSGCALPEIDKIDGDALRCPGQAIALGGALDDDTTGKPISQLPPPLYCEIHKYGSNYRLGIYRIKAQITPALTVRLITNGDADGVLDLRAECGDDIPNVRLDCTDEVAKGGTEAITGPIDEYVNQIFIYAFVEEGSSYTIQTELGQP